MDKIIAFDPVRMFLGEDPSLFYLEICVRILIIWAWTHILLRWIGARSISQLSLAEFLLVIALGSAVGDSLFYPEVPLLQAMLVVLVVILIDKGLDFTIRHVSAAKAVIDGKPVEVLHAGVIAGRRQTASDLAPLELMEMLRLKGVQNLGSVEWVFLERSGSISVFAADPPRMGLQIVPPVEFSGASYAGAEPRCCRNCGAVGQGEACDPCGGTVWSEAVQAPAL
jgi:uncharacterized membrane protein YcaP (DUF421 family)